MRHFLTALCAFLLTHTISHAQNVSGTVKAKEDGQWKLVPGAVVGWVGSEKSVSTDANGQFSIARESGKSKLYAIFLGLKPDTVVVGNKKKVHFQLEIADNQLEEVVVRDKESATTLKKRDPQLTELISARELTKAACCNLSESFETNPAIDASFTDAVTGTRQIRLLGLDGPYSYYTRGNIPTMGGLASVLGLQLIPGNWIQSIQLTKGSGSVINGFESIAGQVNYELRKPDARENLYAQLYGNASGRLEQSMVYNHEINKKWGTNVMLYAREQIGKPDWNDDGFLDMPQGEMYIGQNTWKYMGTNGLETQFGFKYAYNDQLGGQKSVYDQNNSDAWQARMQTKRFEYWHKLGYVFKNHPYRSIGTQWSYTFHDQMAGFGFTKFNPRTYSGLENSIYANFIFQDIIGTTDHTYKLGASYKHHDISEVYRGSQYEKVERIPGVFAEYTYLFKESFSAVAGTRVDNHNVYGTFFTPRLHLRFAPAEHHTFRANVGKAYRTPNVFADNIGSMASNRMWQIEQDFSNSIYNGLQQEESWNTGISYAYDFELDFRPGSFRVEYFYTTFQNRIIKDWDATGNSLRFYNLEGQSYAHSAQVQFDYELIQRLDLRLAYRFVDAKSTYNSIGLAQQPFIAKHRAFANLAYETVNAWKFDFTANLLSSQRLPTTLAQPNASSPAFTTFHFQISKTFRERVEVHIGAENLFNYRMDNPIVFSEDPSNEYFDASMIWGPIMGRVLYAGVRINLLKADMKSK